MARRYFVTPIVCGVLWILGGFAAWPAPGFGMSTLTLYLGSRQAARSIPFVEDSSGEVYTPALDHINTVFGSNLSFQTGSSWITGTAADGTPLSLSVASSFDEAQRAHTAFVSEGQLFVPLRTMARLTNTSFQWDAAQSRATLLPRLSSVSIVPTDGAVRIQVHGSAPFGFVKVSYYDSPWRVILDVNGMSANAGKQQCSVPGVSEVRWREWPAHGHVRIVAQLSSRLPFTIADSGRPNDYWVDVASTGDALPPVTPIGVGSEFSPALAGDTSTGGAPSPGNPTAHTIRVAASHAGDSTPDFTTTAPNHNALPPADPAPAIASPTQSDLPVSPALPPRLPRVATPPILANTGDTTPAASDGGILPPAPVSAILGQMGTAAAAPSEPSEIKDIESRRIDAHTTEVTISASGPITCQSALFDRPTRLVLDVPNASLKLLSPDLNVDSPGVKQIRTGSFPQGSSNSHPRIVLDLTSRSSFQVLSERDRSLIRVLVREMTPGPNGMMTGSPVAGHTICIDPGHCDQFCGARGLYGLKEEEVTLDVAKRLEQLLTAAGANAVMTRTTGAAPSGGGSGLTSDLIERAEIANRAHAEVFLSIHCDANPGHHTIGSLTIYGHDRSIQWASIVYRSLTGTLGHGGTGLHYRPLVKVTEYTNMPSTLAELGFLDTEADAVKLIDLDFRQKEAEGLFHAFETYFGGREQSPPDLPENMPGGAVHPIPSAPGDQAQDHTTADSGDNDDTERSSGE